MEIFRLNSDFPDWIKRGAITIGNFDGVHQGHARIISQLTDFARQVDGKSVVFTFEPHPVRLLRPEEAPPPLTWTERKAELLEELGVDALIAFPTDESLLAKTHDQFFAEVICQSLQAKAMVEGPNFFYGRNREGTIETLAASCSDANILFKVVQPLENDGEMVSSSRIRSAIRDGDVDGAAKWLTHPYRIRGIVTHGAGRGAKIGFPTANLAGIDTLIPANGIYAGRAILSRKQFAAAIHIGPNPTFGEQIQKTEIYILDYQESLYGQTLEVDFLSRLRGIVEFADVAELIAQLEIDVQNVRNMVENTD